MNNPSPLMPQGVLTQQPKAKSTVRIAVFTIVALHAVFFSGLLWQGCKRDTAKNKAPGTSNPAAADSGYAKLDTNYYTPLPEATAVATNVAATVSNALSSTTPPSPATSQTPPIPGSTSEQFGQTPAPSTTLPLPTDTKEYAIAKGDTLAKIAKVHHTTVGEISKANPGLDPRKLKPNQKINIPLTPTAAGAASPSVGGGGGFGFAEPGRTDAGVPAVGALHVVKPGETLTKIAKQHNVTVKALREANGLKTDRLVVKQKLKLPAPAPSAPHADAASTNPAGGTPVR